MASACFCWSAYLVSAGVGLAVLLILQYCSPAAHDGWLVLLMVDVTATLCTFGFSVMADNSSIYDPYWMVAPPLLLVAAKSCTSSGVMGPWQARQVLAMTLVSAWSLRFHCQPGMLWPGFYKGLEHEDWRYVDFRRKASSVVGYWAFSAINFHLIPTVIVFFCLAPAIQVVLLQDEQPPLHALDAVACALGLGSVVIAWIADAQLQSFRASDAYRSGEACRTGLWRLSRHPNYFGEIAFWASLLPLAAAADGFERSPWLPLGWVSMFLMMRFASVPMMDKRSLDRRLNYGSVMENISPLVLWPDKETCPGLWCGCTQPSRPAAEHQAAIHGERW